MEDGEDTRTCFAEGREEDRALFVQAARASHSGECNKYGRVGDCACIPGLPPAVFACEKQGLARCAPSPERFTFDFPDRACGKSSAVEDYDCRSGTDCCSALCDRAADGGSHTEGNYLTIARRLPTQASATKTDMRVTAPACLVRPPAGCACEKQEQACCASIPERLTVDLPYRACGKPRAVEDNACRSGAACGRALCEEAADGASHTEDSNDCEKPGAEECSEDAFDAQWKDYETPIASLLQGPSSAAVRLADDIKLRCSPHKVLLARYMLSVPAELHQGLIHPENEGGVGVLCMPRLSALAEDTADLCLSCALRLIDLPLLSLLLDYSWERAMRSGWPLFALLAQLHLRMRETSAPPEGTRTAHLFLDLSALLPLLRVHDLARCSTQLLLEPGAGGGRGEGGLMRVLPDLCALACQLLSPQEVADGELEERMARLQGYLSEVVHTIDDRQTIVESR